MVRTPFGSVNTSLPWVVQSFQSRRGRVLLTPGADAEQTRRWRGEREAEMYKIKVVKAFAAAHHLRGYKGRCENPHGHNYRVEVELEAEMLGPDGLAVDFGEVKARLDEVLERLDHTDLNVLPEFSDKNPSAENIARLIFEKLEGAFDGGRARISSVMVWESDTSCATYLP